jgi:phage-related protein (TIGR01555 family)
MKKLLNKLFGKKPIEQGSDTPAKKRKPNRIKQSDMDKLLSTLMNTTRIVPVSHKIDKPKYAPNVIPASASTDETWIATDSSIGAQCSYAAQTCGVAGFPGYPYLAELAQISEYRSPSETTAREMTRKWIELKSSNEDTSVSEKIKQIESEMENFKIRSLFQKAAEHDGLYGRSQIFIKIEAGEQAQADEWLATPLLIDENTVPVGSLKGFTIIEPVWTAPYNYNSTDPSEPDFFKPKTWYVLGKKIHASRMLNFVSRPVPDILKPAYNFGGVSMTQLMEPYVQSWFRTRKAVADLIYSFSTSGIKTNMSAFLQGIDDDEDGGSIDSVIKRAETFVKFRDNRGVLLIDKGSEEEFFQFNVPLSGLQELQAQSQEQMAMPSHTPLVKLLGTTPKGLNASADGEINVYFDFINTSQEILFRDNLEIVIKLIQLHLFGKVDDSITFDFVPLKQMDDLQLAQIRQLDANTDVALVGGSIISPEESRKRIASDKDSGHSGLDVDETPTPDLSDGEPDNALETSFTE